MKIAFRQLTGILLLLTYSLLFSQEADRETSQFAKREAIMRNLSGVSLSPELHEQVDNAVRSGKRVSADNLLKSSIITQKANKSALMSKGLAVGTEKKRPLTVHYTREEMEKMPRFRHMNRSKNSGTPAQEISASTVTTASSTRSISSAGENEDPQPVISSPGAYYMNQAFLCKIMGDGSGMKAYANAAIDSFSEIANAPESEAGKEERMDALLRIANILGQILSDAPGRIETYRQILILEPDDEELKSRLKAAISFHETYAQKKGGTQ